MPAFAADMRDVRFNLFDFLKIDELCQNAPFKDFDKSMFSDMLDAARDMARDVVFPLNASGDKTGVRMENGRVKLPKGWKEAYDQYVQMGWNGLAIEQEHGGQGLPHSVHAATQDFFIGSNVSFLFTPGLTSGSMHLICSFGTEEQRAQYVKKMIDGVWAGTMCLTEAGAGTAVPDLKTTATPIPGRDGFYKIRGQKIFISSGDHDLTENIVHLVLARIDGDPHDSSGVSLFIVPRHRVNADGSAGAFNDVTTVGCEEKLGIHACPTCTLSFGEADDCEGWLIGGRGQGLKCMFQMMNEARIAVGAQGMGVANAAYLWSLAYAKERVQGVRIEELRNPKAERVAIIEHPDVRRMLMTMKAIAEGSRALVYYTAYCEDRRRTDGAQGEAWEHQLEILTPVVKAWCSDEAFRVTELGIQVHGGYGYIKEYGVEQLLRDVKIASIYEGTNGIQAMDLLGRKMARRGGAMLMTMISQISSFVDGENAQGPLAKEIRALGEARDAVAQVAFSFMQSTMSGDMKYPALHACDFLQMLGDTVVGWLLLRQAILAESMLVKALAERSVGRGDRAKIASDAELNFLDAKTQTAKFFVHQILPRVHGRYRSVLSEDRSAFEVAL